MSDPKITSITKNTVGNIEPVDTSGDGERRLRACEKKWSRRLSVKADTPKWSTMTNHEEVADYARAITADLFEEYGEHNTGLKTTEMLAHIFAEQGVDILNLSFNTLDGQHSFNLNAQMLPDIEQESSDDDSPAISMDVELPEGATKKDAENYLDKFLSEKEIETVDVKPFIPAEDLSSEDLATLMFSIEDTLKDSNDLDLLLFTAGVLSLWREMMKLNTSTSTIIFQNLTNNSEPVYEGMKVVIGAKTKKTLQAENIKTFTKEPTKTVTFGFGHK